MSGQPLRLLYCHGFASGPLSSKGRALAERFPELERLDLRVPDRERLRLSAMLEVVHRSLGRVLFYDKRLSLTNTHACGSCHHQDHGFAAADTFPVGVQNLPLKRNAMALANSRYNLNEMYFSDGRVRGLEALVDDGEIRNAVGFGAQLSQTGQRLGNTEARGALHLARVQQAPDVVRVGAVVAPLLLHGVVGSGASIVAAQPRRCTPRRVWQLDHDTY